MGRMTRRYRDLEGQQLFESVQEAVARHGADWGLEVTWDESRWSGSIVPTRGITGSLQVRGSEVEVQTRGSGLARLYLGKVDQVIERLLEGLEDSVDSSTA